MSPDAKAEVQRLLARELATAVGAKVDLTGWAGALTERILTILGEDS